jgi:cytochrome b involved in lipid metabolism
LDQSVNLIAAIVSPLLIDNPFFLVTGLPVHTLVVHFAVSMIPLSAIALIAIVLVPRWRGAFLWATLIGLLIGTGAAFISKESGQALADVVGVPKTHSTWGDILPWLALLLLAVAIWWTWLSRHAAKQDPMPRISMGSGLQFVVGIVAIVLSVLAFALTVVVGHTGAAAVWESRSLDTEATEDTPATPAPTTAPAASGSAAASGGYTMADVAAHSTPQDCWSVVSATVYDLTQWIPQHPGGPGVIEAMCGKDGTSAYEGKHGGSASAGQALAGFALGPLGGAAAQPAPATSAAAAASSAAAGSAAPGTYTIADVQAHGTPKDCWSVVDTNVYDLTSWIPQHPGGAGVIEAMCGVDGTDMYNSQHGGSAEIGSILAAFQIGTLA